MEKSYLHSPGPGQMEAWEDDGMISFDAGEACQASKVRIISDGKKE